MAFYSILTNNHRKIAAFKALNPNDTGSWVSVDNNIHVAQTPLNNWDIASLWAVHESGSDIHVATQQVGGRVAYHKFDTSTDLWTIRDETVIAGSLPSDFTSSVSIAIRSDGDVIVLYSKSQSVNYARKEGAAWTTEVTTSAIPAAGEDFRGGVIVPGSSDRMHFFFKKEDGAISSVQQITLRSDNTLETAAQEFDDTGSVASFIIGPGTSYLSVSTKVRIPYIRQDGFVAIGEFDSADTPTITSQSGISDTKIATGSNATLLVLPCLDSNGTTAHLLYVDSSSFDLFHDENVNDGGWGTDDEELDAVTILDLSCNVYENTGSVLAYIYNDSGTVKYGERVLAAGVLQALLGSSFGQNLSNSEIFRQLQVSGDVNSESTIDSSLNVTFELISSVESPSQTQGNVLRKKRLQAVSSAVSRIASVIQRTLRLDATTQGPSEANSEIQQEIRFVAALNALSKTDSNVARNTSLESMVSAMSQVDSNILRKILFDSMVEALSSTDVQLTLTAAFIALEGPIIALSETSANLIRMAAMESVVTALSQTDVQIANLTSLSSIIEALSSVDAQATRTAVLSASVDAFSKIDSRIERTTVLESVVQTLSTSDAKVSRRTTLESVTHAISFTRSNIRRIVRFLSTSVGLAKPSALLTARQLISGRPVGRSIINGGISLVARIAGVIDSIAKTQSQTRIIARMVSTSQGTSRVVEVDGGFTVIIGEEIVVVGGGGLDYARKRREKYWKEQEEKRRKKITATVYVEGIKYVKSVMTENIVLNLDDVYVSVALDEEVGVSIIITLLDDDDDDDE